MIIPEAGGMEERVLSLQKAEQWRRRRRELELWEQKELTVRRMKSTVLLQGIEVDEELGPALSLLWRNGIETRRACSTSIA